MCHIWITSNLKWGFKWCNFNIWSQIRHMRICWQPWFQPNGLFLNDCCPPWVLLTVWILTSWQDSSKFILFSLKLNVMFVHGLPITPNEDTDRSSVSLIFHLCVFVLPDLSKQSQVWALTIAPKTPFVPHLAAPVLHMHRKCYGLKLCPQNCAGNPTPKVICPWCLKVVHLGGSSN
jgi:hypothetical protein